MGKRMTRFTTVEGHEVKVGECYEIRDGSKVYIITVTNEEFKNIIGYLENGLGMVWESNGKEVEQLQFYDLMRPWVEKKPVVEGWIHYDPRDEEDPEAGGFFNGNLLGVTSIKLQYDPNKSGVDAVTVLEVKSKD